MSTQAKKSGAICHQLTQAELDILKSHAVKQIRKTVFRQHRDSERNRSMKSKKGLKTCVWLSRHKPQSSQRKSLAGYRILHCHPPSRYWSAADAWALAQTACDGKVPSLIVLVAPLGMIKDFLRYVAGRAPVITPIMDFSCDPPRFLRWERFVDIQTITEPWMPGSATAGAE